MVYALVDFMPIIKQAFLFKKRLDIQLHHILPEIMYNSELAWIKISNQVL